MIEMIVEGLSWALLVGGSAFVFFVWYDDASRPRLAVDQAVYDSHLYPLHKSCCDPRLGALGYYRWLEA